MIDFVTYPRFYSDGGNFVLYMRLGGGSGNANSHFFNYESGRWTVNTETASKFLDRNWSGGDKTVNAYPQGLAFHNGRRHLTWCWRDTPVATTCHDLCYAYSDDNGKTWLNNNGQVIAETGVSFITADSPGVSVSPIPPGTRYINGGSMTVDSSGRVHVLVRSEDGSPAHFGRDPVTAKWTRQKAPMLGKLVPGQEDQMFIVSDQGLHRASASDFGAVTFIAAAEEHLFEDSGWASMRPACSRRLAVRDRSAREDRHRRGLLDRDNAIEMKVSQESCLYA